MPDTLPSAAPDRLQLTLQRTAGRPGWQAEVHDQGVPRRFESLTELMVWLGTLELLPTSPLPPNRGIR